MRLHQYTLSRAKRGSCPFAGEYDEDYWVAFHGTSNNAEKEIEEKGLFWKDGIYSKADVQRLAEIFKRLHWMGDTFAGFGVLDSYTKNDFHHGGGTRKPIYLAETSRRALLYSSSDNAGGETARALRYAFADLDKYVSSIEFRATAIKKTWESLRDIYHGEVPPDCEPRHGQEICFSHIRALWKYYERRGFRVPFEAIEPVDFTEEWLREELKRLRHVRESSANILSTFEHGVVYAVRLLPEDIPYLSFSSWAGLAAHCPIPSDRILAKAIIPKDFTYVKREDHAALRREEHGIIAAVKSYQSEKLRPRSHL